MVFSITLVSTIMLAFLLKKPIKQVPWLFYALAAIVTVLFLVRDVLSLPALIDRSFFLIMQKNYVAIALFVVVMYIGVFDSKSKVRMWLQPIRAELSIIACILALGHVVSYLGGFGARIIFGGTVYSGFLVASLFVSLILFALLLILGLTSFEFLKRRMTTKSWKRVQYFAYAFYALAFAHILLVLLPPALLGGNTAQISVAIYSVVFLPYFILRFRRLRIDRRPVAVAGISG